MDRQLSYFVPSAQEVPAQPSPPSQLVVMPMSISPERMDCMLVMPPGVASMEISTPGTADFITSAQPVPRM